MHELIGCIEEIEISEILPSQNNLRSMVYDVNQLARSIKQIGLLQPIIVRSINGNFEIIAGSRRFKACKMLGLKKILCHIVQLDNKSAFEVSLIENVQTHSLNPIDEGLAFKKYVHEFGWGGISELAHKICKSPSYVSRRIKLVNLPKELVELISQSAINVTSVEELFSISDKDKKLMLAEVTRRNHLSSRTVRKLVKRINFEKDAADSVFCYFRSTDDFEPICKLFDRAIIVLTIAIKRVASIIEKTEHNWVLYEIMMQHKHILHNQVDLLIKERTKYKKNHLLLRPVLLVDKGFF